MNFAHLMQRFLKEIINIRNYDSLYSDSIYICVIDPGAGGTPYDGLYGEASPERGTFFRLQVYERVEISLLDVYKRVGKSANR